MAEEEKVKGTPPKNKYKSGTLEVAVWEQKGKEEGQTFLTYSFKRSYKDKNDEWKDTATLRTNDIPALKMLLTEAYKDAKLKANEE